MKLLLVTQSTAATSATTKTKGDKNLHAFTTSSRGKSGKKIGEQLIKRKVSRVTVPQQELNVEVSVARNAVYAPNKFVVCVKTYRQHDTAH